VQKRKNKLFKNQDGVYVVKKMPTLEEINKLYVKEYYQKRPSKSYKLKYSNSDLKFNELDYALSESFIKNKKKILDVGCGEGYLLNFFLKKEYKCYGVDITNYGVKNHNAHILNKIIFQKKDINNNDFFENEKFDVIFLINVAEHVIDYKKLFKNINDKLNKNGIFIIKVPNEYDLVHTWYIQQNKIPKEALEIFNPLHHLNYFSKNSLINSVTNNMDVKTIKTYGDFPIEIFMLNKETNFYKKKNFGKTAHKIRVELSNLLYKKKKISDLLNFYEASLNVGVGRSITGVFKKG